MMKRIERQGLCMHLEPPKRKVPSTAISRPDAGLLLSLPYTDLSGVPRHLHDCYFQRYTAIADPRELSTPGTLHHTGRALSVTRAGWCRHFITVSSIPPRLVGNSSISGLQLTSQDQRVRVGVNHETCGCSLETCKAASTILVIHVLNLIRVWHSCSFI